MEEMRFALRIRKTAARLVMVDTVHSEMEVTVMEGDFHADLSLLMLELVLDDDFVDQGAAETRDAVFSRFVQVGALFDGSVDSITFTLTIGVRAYIYTRWASVFESFFIFTEL